MFYGRVDEFWDAIGRQDKAQLRHQIENGDIDVNSLIDDESSLFGAVCGSDLLEIAKLMKDPQRSVVP